MSQANIMMIARKVNPMASIIDIHGEVSALAEKAMMDAYMSEAIGIYDTETQALTAVHTA